MKWLLLGLGGYIIAAWAYPILLGLTWLALLAWVVWESSV